MSPTEETTNEEIPSKGGHASRSSPTILEVGDSKTISPRRFTKEDLHAIDRELRAGPFDTVEWTVKDEQGAHKGQDLSAILDGVLWDTVEQFQVFADRHFERKSSGHRLPMSYFRIWFVAGLQAYWGSAPQHRQPVEFTYKKVVGLLEKLPKQRSQDCVFVTDATREDVAEARHEPRTEGRPWWDPRRAPESISDWLLITAIGGIAVGVILAFIFLAF